MRQRRLLVTAGPSREYFDDVRYLSNGSSGRMGVAVADAAARQGWQVHLALGPVETSPVHDVVVHPFVSAEDLDGICRDLWEGVDALVATAAVCDYRPRERVAGKRKKAAEDWELTLERTPDVLLGRSREKGARTLVGFALEAHPDSAAARRKLEAKNLDLILLNGPANLGSSGGHYRWVEASGFEEELPVIEKTDLAERIVAFLERAAE